MKKTLTKIKTAAFITSVTLFSTFGNVLAAGDDKKAAKEITDKITTATDVVYDIIAAVGGLFIVIGVVKAVRSASKGMDDKVDSGIFTAIAGLAMVSVRVLLGIFA